MAEVLSCTSMQLVRPDCVLERGGFPVPSLLLFRMRVPRTLFLPPWLLVCWLGIALAAPGAAQEAGNAPEDATSGRPRPKPPPVNMVVTLGQGNRVRVGEAMPVRVVLDNLSNPVTARLQVTDSRNTTETVVELPRSAHKVYTLYAPMHPEMGPGMSGELEVRLVDGFRVLNRQRVRPRYVDRQALILSCSGDDGGLQFLSTEQAIGYQESAPTYQAVHVSPEEMPREWPGFRPADVVVVNGRGWSAMDDEQRRALRIWIEEGGRAILCGESSTEWRDPEGISLAAILPQSLAPDPELSALRRWGERPLRLPAGAFQTVTGPLRPGAAVLLREDGRPLVALRNAMLGHVLWCGFDPLREGVRSWSGGQSFWEWALREVRQARVGTPFQPPEGVEPVRLAAGALPRLPAPPIPVILGFGILYAIIFGPVNLWMLQRLRRTVRSWLWMPSLAVGMTVVVLGVGQLWAQARTVLNRVTLVYTAAGNRTAHERSLIGLFSPTNRSFQLAVDDFAPRLTDLGESGAGPAPVLSDSGPTGFGEAPPPTPAFSWPQRQGDGGVQWQDVALQLFS
ncbi:MAG: hypothetical protein FJX77_07830, partial [Armatimonadetes bacterium]|nr:hypothetical protein [Armatimonadota bacterium]